MTAVTESYSSWPRRNTTLPLARHLNPYLVRREIFDRRGSEHQAGAGQKYRHLRKAYIAYQLPMPTHPEAGEVNRFRYGLHDDGKPACGLT